MLNSNFFDKLIIFVKIFVKIVDIINIFSFQYFKYIFHSNKNVLIVNTINSLIHKNPLYAKLFQAICTNSNLFDEKQIGHLIKYTDNVPYTDNDINYDFLNTIANIGSKKSEYNMNINLKPINSGTIAIVYKGSMNNKDIIIKVIKKNIKKELDEVLLITLYIINILNCFSYFKYLDLKSIYDENYDIIIQQTNFIQELENIKLFKKHNKNIDYVVIPEVYDIFTENNPNIIVMDFINGNKITQINEYDSEIFGNLVNKFTIKSLLFDKLYHADLHSGNIFFIKEENISNYDNDNDNDNDIVSEINKYSYKIGIIDFGIIGVLNKEQQNQFYLFFKELSAYIVDYNDLSLFILDTFVEPEHIISNLDIIDKSIIINKLSDILYDAFSIKKHFEISDLYKCNYLFYKYGLKFKRYFCKIELSLAIASSLNIYLYKNNKYIDNIKYVCNELFNMKILSCH